MPRETNLEYKVGAYVIVAFFVLVAFIFSVGDSSFFQKGEIFRLVFLYANGLKISAPVRIAGVETGLVRKMTIFYDPIEKKTKVEVLIWVKENVRIPTDSRILINQLGLFGEKYVEIIPGQKQNQFFTVQDTIIGQTPVMQEDIAQRVLDATSQVEKGVAGISKIINDEENRHSIKNALARLSTATERFDRLGAQIENGRGTVGKLLFDEGLYDDLKMLTTDLKDNPWKLLYRPRSMHTRK